MKKHHKILMPTAILLLLIAGGLLFVSSRENRKTPATLSSLYSLKSFFDEGYAAAGQGFAVENKNIVAGIVPHHLLVKDKIAAFFQTFGNDKIKNIILIGPDHLGRSRLEMTTSRLDWQTPYGVLAVNRRNIDALEKNKFVGEDDLAMSAEFGISGLVPFVKKSFPNAELTPIILSTSVKADRAEALAKFLVDNFASQDTLLIATVDFSHNVFAEAAEKSDVVSNAAIESFDFNKIYSLNLDSPAAIYTVMKYSELLNVKKAVLLSHTNSGILLNNDHVPVTTHNIFEFAR